MDIITTNNHNHKIINPLEDAIYHLIEEHPQNMEGRLFIRRCPDAFARFMGSNDGGLFLAQLIYWTPRTIRQDGFLYKSAREWSGELFITEYQVEQFRKFLHKQGILELKKSLAYGRPTWHYRLNQQELITRLRTFLDTAYAFPDRNIEKDILEISNDVPEILGDTPVIRKVESCFQEMNNNVLLQAIKQETKQDTTSHRNTASSAENGDDTESYEAKLGVTEDGELPKSIRDTGGHYSDALRAVEAFESVGVTGFDVTLRNEQTGHTEYFEKVDFRAIYDYNGQSQTRLKRGLILSEEKNATFIVRPRGSRLVQVDDLDEEKMLVLKPYAFFVEETSAGNFQVWLAFPQTTSELELKSIRQRIVKEVGADTGASGATRWVGSLNLKQGRNRFRVRLVSATMGAITSVDELEDAGLLSAVMPTPQPEKVVRTGFKGTLPDYQLCLERKGYNRSDADASFLAICKERGYSREEAVGHLSALSEKVDERGVGYIERTADFVYGL